MKTKFKHHFPDIVFLLGFVASNVAAFGCDWRLGCAVFAVWCLFAWPLLWMRKAVLQIIQKVLGEIESREVQEMADAMRKTSGKI